MGDYSVLADMLNKFHTSTPLIQALWIILLSLVLLGLGWYFKEICIAFANSIEKTVATFANRGRPAGESIYTIHRNDADEWVVYYNNPTPTQIESHNLVILPTGEGSNQIEGQIENRITEETDEAGEGNESLANSNSNAEEGRTK